MAFFGLPVPDDPEDLSTLLVVGNEEYLHLRKQRLAHIVYSFQLLVIVGMHGDTEEAIVSFRLAFLGLLHLDNANDSDFYETDVGRRIHQRHDVERIALFPKS